MSKIATLLTAAVLILAASSSAWASAVGMTTATYITYTKAPVETFATWSTYYANGTIYDRAQVTGPDNKIIYSAYWVHRAISGTGTKIGFATPGSGSGGGGGGGHNIHGTEPSSVILIIFTNDKNQGSWVSIGNPHTQGTINYHLTNGVWLCDGSTMEQTHEFTPMFSSYTAPYYKWSPMWMSQ